MEITEPDQVWGVDITYVHLDRGFMYLFVIIDWYSRCIVDYELSGTLDKSFVLNCLQRALSGRKPKIINSDQGCHFTNREYIELLEGVGVQISMNGKGQCRDNARTERFFRTLKYDTVYIQEVNSPRELRHMFVEYIFHYNTYRPHSALDGRRPAEVYGNAMNKCVA
jgi:putative transposase